MHTAVGKRTRLTFLKLGGSLITDKKKPRTVQLEVIKRLVEEISYALDHDPDLKLVLGHGSGSFGHVPAKKHGTRMGVSSRSQWLGFIDVWRDANLLNRFVMDCLGEAGIPAIAFPPSASIIANNGEVVSWDLTPIQNALAAGILPVLYGDVIFDQQLGGTIFSTEDLFTHMNRFLLPNQILLAGIEPGVWRDFPSSTILIEEITPENIDDIQSDLLGSTATDVTGGMSSKVFRSLDIVRDNPGLEVLIFSGLEPGNVSENLLGSEVGTRLLDRSLS